MHTLRRHSITLFAAAALVAVGAPVAQAQPKDPGSHPGVGQSCGGGQFGGSMQDGERIARHYANGESSTSTCTNGERCDTWSTLQDDGTLSWFYQCTTAPEAAVVAHSSAATTPTPKAR